MAHDHRSDRAAPCLGPWLRTASTVAALVVLAPLATAQDRDATASSFEDSVALIRPTVQPTGPGDVSTDVAPADLLRPIEPDHRLEQDRNAFNDPAAGYDPRRFRIEPVPREDRRIREFFEIEPYAPLGWRLGSFILYSELEVGGGWNSNVLNQPSAQSDWLAELASETRLVTDWATTRSSSACGTARGSTATSPTRVMRNAPTNSADASTCAVRPTLKSSQATTSSARTPMPSTRHPWMEPVAPKRSTGRRSPPTIASTGSR